MRRCLFAAVLVGCTAATPQIAHAFPARIDIRANDVAFYPYTGRMLLAGTGHVVVRIGTRTITARAIQLDLGRNRLLASGDVHIARGGDVVVGNAFTLNLGDDAGVLMRLGPLPATFRIHGDDVETVESPAPLESFAALDLDGQRPYMRSHHAIVVPNGAVRMTPAIFPTAAGPSARLPTFLYTLVQNPYIAQSAAPPASFDQPYNLAGNANSLAAANLRYDAQNGVTLGVDEHLVDATRAYVAASLLPLRDRQADITAYEVVRRGLQQTVTFTQTAERGATTAASYKLQASGPSLIETLAATRFDGSTSAAIDVSTYARDVGRYFSYQVHANYGYDHTVGGYPYTDDLRAGAGGFLASPTLTVRGVSVNLKADYAFTAFDFPHQVVNDDLTWTLGRALGRNVRTVVTIAFAQNDNRYRDVPTGVVALGLPNPDLPYLAPDGTPYPGYFAYSGLSTLRTYEAQTTIQGRGDDRVQLTLVRARDFPQFHGYGRPPFDVGVDIKRRITPTLAIELGRSYSFGWGGQYLSPQYYLAISP